MKKYIVIQFILIFILSGCSKISNRTEDIFIEKILEENGNTSKYSIGEISYLEKAKYPENWETPSFLFPGESGFQEVWCVVVETGPFRNGNYPENRYLPFVLSRKGEYWIATNVLQEYYFDGPFKAFAVLGCDYDIAKWGQGWMGVESEIEEISTPSIKTSSLNKGIITFFEHYNLGLENTRISLGAIDGSKYETIVTSKDLGNELTLESPFFHWSPNGEYLVLTGNKHCIDSDVQYKCRSVIFLWVHTTGELIQLTSLNEYAGFWGWFPDSKKILIYVYDISSGYDKPKDTSSDKLVVLDIDGLQRVEIQDTADLNLSWPVLSPNGTQIALVADTEDLYYPYLMNSDGSNLRKLSSEFKPTEGSWAIFQSKLHWSPDGNKIAFSAGKMHIDKRDSYLYDVKTGSLSNLSNKRGYTIFGWLDNDNVLAADGDKGIVSININGEVSSLIKGEYWIPENSCSCSYSSSMNYIILHNQDSRNYEIWDISSRQMIINLSEIFPNTYSFCWQP